MSVQKSLHQTFCCLPYQYLTFHLFIQIPYLPYFLDQFSLEKVAKLEKALCVILIASSLTRFNFLIKREKIRCAWYKIDLIFERG